MPDARRTSPAMAQSSRPSGSDAPHLSIRRDRPIRPYQQVRGQDDATRALRGRQFPSPHFQEMVGRESAGREACQAYRRKEGVRCHRSQVGNHHASHMDRRHGVSVRAARCPGSCIVSSRRSNLLCPGRGEGQSVSIPVPTRQARASELGRPDLAGPHHGARLCGRLRTEAWARQTRGLRRRSLPEWAEAALAPPVAGLCSMATRA
jgi:hypothetical protein